MGSWWSNRTRTWVALLVLVLSGCIIFLITAARSKTPLEVAANAGNRVVLAYKLSKISGTSDWQDCMESAHSSVKSLPIEARLRFYTIVLSECELFAATSLEFVEVVGGDAAALQGHLKKLMEMQSYGELDSDRQRRVRFWSEHLVDP